MKILYSFRICYLCRLKKRDFKNRLASSELGLTVVLNASHADYFAPVLNTNGYIVIIHDADNFASPASSSALETFPGQNEESYLKIFPRVIETENSLHAFSPFGVSSSKVTIFLFYFIL